MDAEVFVYSHYDNDNKRKFIPEDNTYILALDGDTDFQPKAVVLLVDRSATNRLASSSYCLGSGRRSLYFET